MIIRAQRLAEIDEQLHGLNDGGLAMIVAVCPALQRRMKVDRCANVTGKGGVEMQQPDFLEGERAGVASVPSLSA